MRFEVKPHTKRPGEQMVEIHDGDVFLGALYPFEADKGPGVTLISKHFGTVSTSDDALGVGTIKAELNK